MLSKHTIKMNCRIAYLWCVVAATSAVALYIYTIFINPSLAAGRNQQAATTTLDRPKSSSGSTSTAFIPTSSEAEADWGCDNLPADLRDVLEPHCIVHGSNKLSSLSTMLPNLDFFRRVVNIFDSHARAEVWRLRQRHQELMQEWELKAKENTTEIDATLDLVNKQLKEKAGRLVDYVLVAGRGTTGTRSVSKWLGGGGFSDSPFFQQQNIGDLHFKTARCPIQNTRISNCYKKILSEGIRMIRSALIEIRNKPTIYVKEGAYEQLFNALEYYVGHPLQECGECMKGNLSSPGKKMPTCHNGFGGRVALLDSPLVGLFTELYFALGPDTKVILLRRDKNEWIKSRVSNHGKSMTGIVCGNENAIGYHAHALQDPFSYTQCVTTASSIARHKQSRDSAGMMRGDTSSNKTTTNYNNNYAHIQNIGDIDGAYLAESYDKYNLYVEKLIPHNYRLDINLFTSSLFSKDDIRNDALRNKKDETTSASARERWTSLNRQLVEEFVAC